ncbi:MAG: nuclear transport factor 2 family protein [Mariniblastus sp.]|nr:nuclear transport factor 2 family protein [Mariniblastus sp.]
MRSSAWLICLISTAWLLPIQAAEAQDPLPLAKRLESGRSATESPVQTDNLERELVHAWQQYSRAFEYADYPQIAKHFTLPATFVDPSGQAENATDQSALIDWFRNVRENVQAGYKYSLIDHFRFQHLTPSICQLDVTYGRFNASYQRVHTGRGLYFFRKTTNGWRIYAIFALPTEPLQVSKGDHQISVETVYYTTGPQQGRAPDGKFPAGTVVTVLKEAGSYRLVESDSGIVGYVESGSVERIADQ